MNWIMVKGYALPFPPFTIISIFMNTTTRQRWWQISGFHLFRKLYLATQKEMEHFVILQQISHFSTYSREGNCYLAFEDPIGIIEPIETSESIWFDLNIKVWESDLICTERSTVYVWIGLFMMWIRLDSSIQSHPSISWAGCLNSMNWICISNHQSFTKSNWHNKNLKVMLRRALCSQQTPLAAFT